MVTSIVSNSSYSLAAFSLKSNAEQQTQAVSRIASGTQSSSGRNPLETDSVSFRLKTSASMTSNIVSNIGNALSFLEAQANSLTQISSLVTKMGDIVSQMQDPMKSSEDLVNYMQEFKSLRLQLASERNATYGGQKLHDKDGSSSPFGVQIDSAGTQSISFASSSFLANGGGAWDTLIGTDAIDLTVTSGTVGGDGSGTGTTPPTDNAVYGTNSSSVSQQVPSSSNNSSSVEISGEPVGMDGYGTRDITDTAENLRSAAWGVSSFTSLIEGVSAMISTNSAQQSSLRRGLDTVNARSASLAALNDSITETDVAHEVSSLAKSQLLNQSASSAMVQTNVSAEGVVKALWGEISSGIDWYQPELQKSILPKISFA